MNTQDNAKARLLAVARDLFLRRGYEEVSVREITSRAKANLGAITYHFGSKEALYHATLAAVVEPLVQAVAASAQAPGNALDRIEAIIRAFLRWSAEHPAAPAVLLRELASDHPLPPPMARAMKENIGALVAAVVAGQQDGSIRAGDPTLLALSAVAQPFYFRVAGRMIQHASGIDPKSPEVRGRMDEHIITGVRRTLATSLSTSP